MTHWPRRFAALGTVVELQATDAETRATLSAMTGTYSQTGAEPDLCYRFAAADGWRLWRNREEVCLCEHALDMPPMFEVDLHRQLLQRSVDRWLLHAGAVADERGAVLLAGDSGAGKTTLTLAMTAAGMRYLSDELVAIDTDLHVQGMCRPLALPPDVPVPRSFLRATVTVRGAGGEPVETTLVHPPAERLCHGPAPGVAIVVLRFAPHLEPDIEAIRPGDALERAWRHALGPGPQAFAIAADAVRRLPVWSLVTRNVPDAVAAIEMVLEETGRGAG
jgi:hypothetical protein